MADNIAISLKNVSKVFRRYHHPVDRLKELLLPGKQRADEFWALQDINLEILQGETLGILGRNGSGKSTLLQIIAGTLQPTTGDVRVNGRISALLELGSGFNPEFTGRQNVFFNGRILGLSQEEIESRFDEIAAFADIGEFIDQPVKTYSSGMFVRLAFSVVVSVDPDVLIVDEALAVGDMRFQQRCITKIRALQDQGVSIFFVSHDLDGIKRLCKKAVVINQGRIVRQGAALEIATWYVALSTVDFDITKVSLVVEESDPDTPKASTVDEVQQCTLNKQEDKEKETQSLTQTSFNHFRHGDKKAKIVGVWVKNSKNEKTETIILGEKITVVTEIIFFSVLESHLVGIVIRDRLGTDVIGINTYQENLSIPAVKTGDSLRYEFEFSMNVKPGSYGVCPSAAYDQYSGKWLDWIDNALVVNVVDPKADRYIFGVYFPAERNLKVSAY